MPSILELAELCNCTYRDSSRPINKFSELPKGWEIISRSDSFSLSSESYLGIAFKKESEKCIVIAHRGTDLNNTADLKADFELGILQNIPTAWYEAKKFSARIRETTKEMTWVYIETGHSLGAIHAELNAVNFIGKAVTFESPGIRTLLTSKLNKNIADYLETESKIKNLFSQLSNDLSQDQRERLLKEIVESQKLLNNHNFGVVSYMSAPNFINTANPHIGKIIRIFTYHVCIDNDINSAMKELSAIRELFVNLFFKVPLEFTPKNIFNFIKDAMASFGLTWSELALKNYWTYQLRLHSLDNLIRAFSPVTNQPKLAFHMESWPSRQDFLQTAAKYYNELFSNTFWLGLFLTKKKPMVQINLRFEEIVESITGYQKSAFMIAERPAEAVPYNLFKDETMATFDYFLKSTELRRNLQKILDCGYIPVIWRESIKIDTLLEKAREIKTLDFYNRMVELSNGEQFDIGICDLDAIRILLMAIYREIETIKNEKKALTTLIPKRRKSDKIDKLKRQKLCFDELVLQGYLLNDQVGRCDLFLKMNDQPMFLNNLYFFLKEADGKTKLFYETKSADNRTTESELTDQDIQATTFNRIIAAVRNKTVQSISEEDKQEVLEIASRRNHIQYDILDITLKLLMLTMKLGKPMRLLDLTNTLSSKDISRKFFNDLKTKIRGNGRIITEICLEKNDFIGEKKRTTISTDVGINRAQHWSLFNSVFGTSLGMGGLGGGWFVGSLGWEAGVSILGKGALAYFGFAGGMLGGMLVAIPIGLVVAAPFGIYAYLSDSSAVTLRTQCDQSEKNEEKEEDESYYFESEDESAELIEYLSTQDPSLANLAIRRSSWKRDKDPQRKDIIVGEGRFSTVYSGMFFVNNTLQKIAIKAILESKINLKTLSDEISNCDKLKHSEYVVSLYGISRHKSIKNVISNSFIMELADCTLEKYLDEIRDSKKPRLTENQQITLALHIAKGIKDMHAQNIVHSDLKDRNILLFKDERNHFYKAKVADIELAKIKNPEAHLHTTSIQERAGTKIWQAPEVYNGVDHSLASDMFSFGMILWRIVSQGANIDPRAIARYSRNMDYRLPIHAQSPELLREIIKGCWVSMFMFVDGDDDYIRPIGHLQTQRSQPQRLSADEVVAQLSTALSENNTDITVENSISHINMPTGH